MANKPVYYSQEDPRWAKLLYSNHRDPKQTIGTSACGTVCFAMVASSFLDRPILPPETSQYAVDHGFRTDNNGTDWGFFRDISVAKKYGLECRQTASLDEVKKALATGNALAIGAMGPGHVTGNGHYITLVGIRGDWIDVFDPNHDNTKYGNDGLVDQGVRNDGKVAIDESVFRREAKQYWIFSSPIKEEDEDELKLTDSQKKLLIEAIKKLEAQKVITDPGWRDKAEKGTLTLSELTWLNTIVLSRK
jgi:hypothetical protein